MKVTVAKNSGFCGGVKLSSEIVNRLLREGKAPIQTYGELAHNPDIGLFLRDKGITIADSIEEVIEGAHVVVRAHGVPDSEMALIKEKTSFVYDGKCPMVGALQKGVAEKVAEGYFAVILGIKGHPEIVCVTRDLSEASYAIVSGPDEAIKSVKKMKPTAVYLCAKTTEDPLKFSSLSEKLKYVCTESGIEMEAKDTTCKPTSTAKVFTRELAGASDAMVIVGGKNSANTLALAEVCMEVYGSCEKVLLVENGRELKQYLRDSWFAGIERVGVSAGTSTPPWVIRNVCKMLEKYR